ncbi:response regulator [Bradyrhizobium sp. WSM2254]|uniref:response regulator n=1 Tax=Bradyrhizobium sp. WSM2254 TaxID=1188263 RepID=UPI0007C54CB8|nr:response regulator [Bradyrhizobium sp. WSM2254]
MNVLIIEDDPQKAERVISAIQSAAPDSRIELRRSYQSGLKYLESDADVNLVILDVSLPTFDPDPDVRQGRPRPLGGYEILRKVRRRKKGFAVVILTALEHFGSSTHQYSFEQLKEKCTVEFPESFLGAIYYSQSTSTWRDQLADLIRAVWK